MFCFRAFIASLAACAMLAVPDAEAYEFPPVDDEVAARVETCISFTKKSTRIAAARQQLETIELEWLEIEEKRSSLTN